jgi:hypothetical protein
MVKGIPARLPRRSNSVPKLLADLGPPRSLVNTYGKASCSRCRRHKVRISSPCIVLREIASRTGCEIVKVYRDHGISGAKGRDKRPAFDKLCRDAARREFDMVMAWSVDRLGRSLQDADSG